ncbi:DUF779 domain-containing protein [Streptomyces sp. L7]
MPGTAEYGTVGRVTATRAARKAIAALRAAHGRPVMFVQSGGCCDGSDPMCFPGGEFAGRRRHARRRGGRLHVPRERGPVRSARPPLLRPGRGTGHAGRLLPRSRRRAALRDPGQGGPVQDELRSRS